MYEYICGIVAFLTPTYAVLEVGGVGYRLEISMQSYGALRPETEAKLYVHQVLREDSNTLFGFVTEAERVLFRQLITVSGVGPASARMLLSAYASGELCDLINGGDDASIRRVKGIGQMTSQRIVLDLQGKVGQGEVRGGGVGVAQGLGIREEALSALVTLGFNRGASEKVVDQVLGRGGVTSVEGLIKASLKEL